MGLELVVVLCTGYSNFSGETPSALLRMNQWVEIIQQEYHWMEERLFSFVKPITILMVGKLCFQREVGILCCF